MYLFLCECENLKCLLNEGQRTKFGRNDTIFGKLHLGSIIGKCNNSLPQSTKY